MGVIGGVGGHVVKDAAAVGCVRGWGISYSSAPNQGVCSASKGGTFRIPGNLDWSGQYTAFGHTPIVMPGTTFGFAGAITGSGETAVGASGDAIVDSVQINWDMEAGTPINHQVNFSAVDALTIGTVTVAADDTIAAPATSLGMLIKGTPYPFGGVAGSEVTYADVRTATLTLSRSNPSYNSSATAGQTSRVQGNFDATLEISCYASDSDGWASFPQPNSVHQVKIYVSATAFWDLKWILWGGLTGLDVDIEGGAIVGASMSGTMQAYWNPDGTWAVGSFKNPATTEIWPPA